MSKLNFSIFLDFECKIEILINIIDFMNYLVKSIVYFFDLKLSIYKIFII